MSTSSPKPTPTPVVMCPGCHAPMTLRVIEPSPVDGLSTAQYHCPICQTDTQRQYKVDQP